MKKVGIIDYGQGNIYSLSKALTAIKVNHIISNSKTELEHCTHLILPGVGAFNKAVESLKKYDLMEYVKSSTKQIMGICLGAQLLYESSEELGFHEGLGILKGKVIQFNQSEVMKLMNVGWRPITSVKTSLKFSSDKRNSIPLINNKEFYFVHKYYIASEEENAIHYNSMNGDFPFTAAVETSQILACQFHPEKSGRDGLELLQYFINKTN